MPEARAAAMSDDHSVTRVLTILGSGETSPTMVTPHQRLFSRLGPDARAVLLDTPYGFQENADELTEKAQQFFRESVGRTVEAVTFRSAPAPDPAAHAVEMARLRAADWIFAGPGSPSYALRTWSGSPVPDALHARLLEGGAVTFASAAALTLGLVTIPVYEIYKVGEDPHWLEGLDVLGRATGLRAAVVPHWNNAEGGTHDTRFCWQGERRLTVLESLLPDDAFVLGVDEHTGLVIDLDSGACEVVGRGTVVVRVHGDEWVVPTGETISLEQIAGHGRSAGTAAPMAPSGEPAPSAAETEDTDAFADLVAQTHGAIGAGDLAGAIALIMSLDRLGETPARRTEVQSLLARAAANAGDRVDVTETVRPLVDLVLALRAQARAEKRFAESDTIRDGIAAAGIEVRDTPDGVTWEVRR
jgi:cyanophycinase-like exopeptidase